MFNVRLAGDQMAVDLAVAGDVLMVSYFVLSFFPRDVFDETRHRIKSIPENFLTYS